MKQLVKGSHWQSIAGREPREGTRADGKIIEMNDSICFVCFGKGGRENRQVFIVVILRLLFSMN